jgi:hypothetical protein
MIVTEVMSRGGLERVDAMRGVFQSLRICCLNVISLAVSSWSEAYFGQEFEAVDKLRIFRKGPIRQAQTSKPDSDL